MLKVILFCVAVSLTFSCGQTDDSCLIQFSKCAQSQSAVFSVIHNSIFESICTIDNPTAEEVVNYLVVFLDGLNLPNGSKPTMGPCLTTLETCLKSNRLCPE